MGGAEAEVHDGTTGIVLEVAYFAPMGISMTSKRLGLRSEASARFERGVDPNGVLRASDRIVELLADVAAAPVGPPAIDAYPVPVERERIRVRPSRVGAVLGLELSPDDVRDALLPLGIEIEELGEDAGPSAAFVAVAPTFRPDLTREIDIVEEVGRRIGLDSIPRTLPHTTEQSGGLTPVQRARRRIGDVLVGLGLREALTIPLIAEADLTRFGRSIDGTVRATNALNADEPVLRPAILPGLLKSVARNVGYGITDLAFFELGHVFAAPPSGQLLPDERDHLAVVISGSVRRAPVEPDRAVDVYDATDTLRAVVDEMQLAAFELRAADHPGFRPGRSATGRGRRRRHRCGGGAGPERARGLRDLGRRGCRSRSRPRHSSAAPAASSTSCRCPPTPRPRWTSRSCSTSRCPPRPCSPPYGPPERSWWRTPACSTSSGPTLSARASGVWPSRSGSAPPTTR